MCCEAYSAAAFGLEPPSSTPMMSLSFMINRSWPSIVHLGARPFAEQNHAVAGPSRPCAITVAVVAAAPGPTAMTSPCEGFS